MHDQLACMSNHLWFCMFGVSFLWSAYVCEGQNKSSMVILCVYSYFQKPIDGSIYSFKGWSGMTEENLAIVSTRMFMFLLALLSGERPWAFSVPQPVAMQP